MKKIRLNPDALLVDSFNVTVARGARGTVHANESWQAYCTLGATCAETACAHETEYGTCNTACGTCATYASCDPCTGCC